MYFASKIGSCLTELIHLDNNKDDEDVLSQVNTVKDCDHAMDAIQYDENILQFEKILR